MREHDAVKLYKVIMVCLLLSPQRPYNIYCRIFLNSWEHECHTVLDMSILMGTHSDTVTKCFRAFFLPGTVCCSPAQGYGRWTGCYAPQCCTMKLPPSKVDHWICGRFSREPENYKILQCALPTKSRAARFNCSSTVIFCTMSCDSFMIFKMNYKICHLRTYILVWDISTSILYAWTLSPIFILEKESRTKTMTHGRESFYKCDFKKQSSDPFHHQLHAL